MNVKFQLLDCDYINPNGQPVIRLFGKTKEGKSITCFFKGFYPYFYVLPASNQISEFLKQKFGQLIVSIQPTEKFLPIGYDPEKKKLPKITLTDPSKVPKVRDELLNAGLAKEVFEADILFKYRFMIDYNLFGSRWYEVSGTPIKTESTKTNLKLEIKEIKEAEPEELSFKILTLDIEVASKIGVPDPKKDPIIIISLYFSPPYKKRKQLVLVASKKVSNSNTISFENEKEMLKQFLEIIDDFDPDIILGYNIIRFDLPYLLKRLEVNKLKKTIGRCSEKPAVHKKFGNSERVSVPGRVVVDPYVIFQEYNKKGILRLKRFGLGDVSKQFLGEDKVDIAHSQIYEIWKNGKKEEIEKLINYSAKDAELTFRLFEMLGLLDTFLALSKVSGALLQDVLDGGEASRLENLLIREFDKRGFVVPTKPSSKEVMKRTEERAVKGLKGALVLDPVIGLHKNVLYMDYKSMYPNIIISYNICPTTILLNKKLKVETIETPNQVKFVSKKVRHGIFPQILKRLIEERDKIKKKLKSERDEKKKKLLNAEQLALKYLANAFYGYTGYLRARLYLLDIANAITSSGRFLISKTKEVVEQNGYQVVYGDTDSVMIKSNLNSLEELFELGNKLEKLINKELEGIVTMKVENVFKTLLILSKKRYAGLAVEKEDSSYKEKIVMKGIETVRRDWCTLTEETLERILEIILKEQNPQAALAYIREVIQKLQRNEIPIEKLVIVKSISRPINAYKGIQPHIELVKKLRRRGASNIPGVGDRVSYVIVQGPQLVSKRAEDPAYVIKNNLKIDSQYYLEAQILPPLERVFEALGYKRQEILNIGKQLTLGRFNGNNKGFITDYDGFVCVYCNETYETLTLSGKCPKCNGPLYFYQGSVKAKEIKWSS